MEESLKFNSQICTTKEQSQRLLDLGLKPETADMVYTNASLPFNKDEFHIICKEYSQLNREVNYEISPFIFIPAWSLHRLIELCGVERMPISFYKKGKVMIRVNHIHPTHTGRSNYNHYDSLIDCIEWLIQEGHFNKEYLKQ